jgi:hypothetical protein
MVFLAVSSHRPGMSFGVPVEAMFGGWAVHPMATSVVPVGPAIGDSRTANVEPPSLVFVRAIGFAQVRP